MNASRTERSNGLQFHRPSFLRLQHSLARQPVRLEAFVIFLKFRPGLTVRYRLPRRQINCPSIGFVCNLLLGGSLRFDHLVSVPRPLIGTDGSAYGLLSYTSETSKNRVDNPSTVASAKRFTSPLASRQTRYVW